MNLIDTIKKSDKKSKALVEFLVRQIEKEKPTVHDFELALKMGSDAERGSCVEAMEFISQKKPEFVISFIPLIITTLSDKAPRVKWESARVIGNIAQKYPKQAEKAIQALFLNTKDKGTVVRWSVAFALGEILKSTKNKTLLSKIEAIIKSEKSSGVKNVYLKAMKDFQQA